MSQKKIANWKNWTQKEKIRTITTTTEKWTHSKKKRKFAHFTSFFRYNFNFSTTNLL